MLLYVNPVAVNQALQPGLAVGSPGRERLAVNELEHYFTFMLLHEMRKSVSRSDLWGDRESRRIYEEMFDDALSGAIAKGGQLGIGKMVEAQLQQARDQKKLRQLEFGGSTSQVVAKGVASRVKYGAGSADNEGSWKIGYGPST